MNTPQLTSRRVFAKSMAAVAVLAAGATASGTTHAYPPQPPGDRSIEVVVLEPNCELDVPYVVFEISPVGFESTGPAQVTVEDLEGNVVGSFESPTLTGKFIYPGASKGPDGTATDWPGWVEEDGVWVEDPTDAHLRDGLQVTFEVNPTVTQLVEYPPAASECAGPQVSSLAAVSPAQGSLPSTGNSGMSTTLLAAGLALLLGVAVTSWSMISSRRREAASVDASA